MVSTIVTSNYVKSRLNITDATLARYINNNELQIKVIQGQILICKESFDNFKKYGKKVGYQAI